MGYQNKPWELVSDKDILVFTSSLETFGLVLVEAILNGVPTIISDNPGHVSVNRLFDSSTMYPLGDIDELTAQLAEAISDFAKRKQIAEEGQRSAKEIYTLEKCSYHLVEHLNPDTPYRKKSIQEIAFLFNWPISKDVLETVSDEQITIFYEHSDEGFSLLNAQFFPILQESQFTLPITHESKLRIDLSESPGAYDDVSLISQTTGQDIVPIFSNAVSHNGRTVFMNVDPQLVYDVRDFQGDTLIFSYKKSDRKKYLSDMNEIINQQKEELHERQVSLSQLEEELSHLTSKYDELNNTYKSVITSRRWTIPTKIINFLRREK